MRRRYPRSRAASVIVVSFICIVLWYIRVLAVLVPRVEKFYTAIACETRAGDGAL